MAEEPGQPLPSASPAQVDPVEPAPALDAVEALPPPETTPLPEPAVLVERTEEVSPLAQAEAPAAPADVTAAGHAVDEAKAPLPQKPANLRQAVLDALAAAPEAALAQAERATARARYRQAGAAMGPTLRARYAYGRDDFENISRPDGIIVDQRSLLVSVTQPLFDGMASWERRRQGREEMSLADERLSLAREGAAAEAADAYFRVLQQRALVEVHQRNERQHQEYVSRVRRLVDAGTARSTDLELVLGRSSQAGVDLLKQRSALDEAEAMYRLRIGQAPATLAEPDRAAWPPATSLPQAIDRARAESAELRGLEAAERAARHALGAARGALSPVLSLEASHSDRQDIDGVSNGFRDERSNRVLLAVDYSFRSGLELARISEARAQLEAAQARLRQADEQLAAHVIAAWSRLDAVRGQTSRVRERAARARTVRIGFDAQFGAGLRSLLDLLGAAAEENGAEAALLSVTYEEAIASAELLSHQGLLLRTVLGQAGPEAATP
ncbi:MAG TPA: TolC family protein [Solimonas sp.]|nr:TolC family protein [Solimonas sp.]